MTLGIFTVAESLTFTFVFSIINNNAVTWSPIQSAGARDREVTTRRKALPTSTLAKCLRRQRVSRVPAANNFYELKSLRTAPHGPKLSVFILATNNVEADRQPTSAKSFLWSSDRTRNPGPKFTNDLRTILRQFSELRQSMTTGEFTEHLQQ